MKKTGIILLCILGLAVAVKVAWSIAYPSGTWRYKMTVEVETPEGVKTGSAVREVYVRVGDHGGKVLLKGEAVVVDLGQRGVLFALLNGYFIGSDYGSDIPFYIFKKNGVVPFSREGIEYFSNLRTPQTVLTPQWYPKLVRFRDINAPKTVENLLEIQSDGKHPSSFMIKKDHFAEAFGEGVRLKSVAIEMTDEDVTWGIESFLKWLPDRRNTRGYIGGTAEEWRKDPSGTYLTGVEFSKGRFW